MARETACGLDPLPATALPAAASEMPRNATTASFIVLSLCMSTSPLRGARASAVQVLAEEELTSHVDVQDEEVRLVRRQLRRAHVGDVTDRTVRHSAIRECADRRIDEQEA